MALGAVEDKSERPISVGSRILLTSLLWFVGASMAVVFDGQTYTNSLILVGCCVAVMVLWAPLLWKKSRPSIGARAVAILVLAGNLLLILWTSLQLSEAREFQRQFNSLRQQESDRRMQR